jgi:hypothetical protein
MTLPVLWRHEQRMDRALQRQLGFLRRRVEVRVIEVVADDEDINVAGGRVGAFGDRAEYKG